MHVLRALASVLERIEHKLARVDSSSECCPYPDKKYTNSSQYRVILVVALRKERPTSQ